MRLTAFLSCLILAGTSLAFGGDAPSSWDPAVFPISYWCGPPAKFTTLERYREIKEANFTYAFPIYGGCTPEDVKHQLNYCQQVGLKAFVYDGRMPGQLTDASKAGIDAMIKDYSSHPALAGYFITDEPAASAFPGLAQVNAYLHEKDPKHPGFINLYPVYIRTASAAAMGYPTYEEHVRKYAEIVKPFAISYDHYHFYKGADGPEFFENLDTVRKVGLETNTPTWNIVQLTEWGSMRNLTEPELRWEAMQTLAYGYKGLIWFTYWNPKDFDATNDWKHAVINPDGSRDPHYDMVKSVNADVLAIGSQLLHATTTAVYQIGTIPPHGTTAPKNAPINIKGPAELTVGLFATPTRYTIGMIVNRDYKNPSRFSVTLPAHCESFDRPTRAWKPAIAAMEIPPGDSILLRW